MINVVLAGSRNRQLDDLLRAAGMQTASIELGALPALASSTARLPDVLVLDIRESGEMPPVVAEIRRMHPSTGVVIVGSALDPAMLLAAMRAGVNEVVTDPVTKDSLESAIARVLDQRPAPENGQVVAVVGAKGGVGATTVAVNVATTLGSISRPKRTLLIDLHYTSGDAALFLGAEPRFTIVDALENTRRLDATFFHSLVTQVAPGLDLLASSDRAIAAPVEPSRLRTIIDFGSAAYKYTVLDLPRSDSVALDSLDRASAIVIVANQELATIRSASRMATILSQRYGRDRVTVVVSRSDRQSEISPEQVERAIGCEVVETFPSDYRRALHALNKGRPLALDNHNDLSGSLRRFAFRLAGIKPERPSAAGGLLSRLTSSRRS